MLRWDGDARAAAAATHAIVSGEAILQIAPDEQERPPRHDHQVAAADDKLERDHAERIEDERARRRAREQPAEEVMAEIECVHRIGVMSDATYPVRSLFCVRAASLHEA